MAVAIASRTAVRRCSAVTTFFQELFDDLQIERLVRHEPLQLAILLLQRLEALRLTDLEPAVGAPPAGERRLGDAVPAAELADRRPRLGLRQDRYDLRALGQFGRNSRNG